MDINKKKQLQEKIYKIPTSKLKYITDLIHNNHKNIKCTKNYSGYFYNMNNISEETLLKINEYVDSILSENKSDTVYSQKTFM
jgi:hypothetical protein